MHALFTPSYTILSIDTLFPLPSGDVNKKVGGEVGKRGSPEAGGQHTGEGEGGMVARPVRRPNETTKGGLKETTKHLVCLTL